MVYMIAAALLVAAVAILTLPWSRRDPADFTLVERGYAARGAGGALVGAMSTLVGLGVAQRSRAHGLVRTNTALARGAGDPLSRAVYKGIGNANGLVGFMDLPDVEAALAPVGAKVTGAGLRVGPGRRTLGSFAALAAPVVAATALARGAGHVALGVTVGVVALVVAGWLLNLRGVTVAGARTLAPRPREGASGVRLSHASVIVSLFAVASWSDGGFSAAGGGFDGGGDGGGDAGGGGY
ncbi:hypothetical protein [Actinophytocola sp.]|uniref:hypothetical protein n=1 Tax=Actinophytocola sp. TaxID=1872138 RepID=UPI002ED050AE